MSITVKCPRPTALASAVTSVSPCPQEVGQIQKILFWRKGNSISTIASALLQATWTTLLSATGNTKVVVSPLLTGAIAAGDARESGGGNETLDGIPIVIGANPAKFEGMIHQYDQTALAKIKKWAGENLEAILVNESGQLVYRADGLLVKGFPIKSLFVGDANLRGFAESDMNAISFYMPANYSDNLTISAGTTFALDLVNV